MTTRAASSPSASSLKRRMVENGEKGYVRLVCVLILFNKLMLVCAAISIIPSINLSSMFLLSSRYPLVILSLFVEQDIIILWRYMGIYNSLELTFDEALR